MSRYFIELAYKGTSYSGFQVQDNAGTIQEELSKAMKTLFREAFELTGSSRTDSGVHALQNYFHFDTGLELGFANVYNLNAILPQDITVKNISRVPDAAHCRFDAVSREYRYHIYTKKNPFLNDRAWLYPFPLDLELLQAAARQVQEHTDFTSFAKRNTQVKTYNCTIQQSAWHREGGDYFYEVRGNRFLRGMVRGLVATMLKVGRGQISLAEFKEILAANDNTKADFSAPPQGLFLVSVGYEGKLAEILAAETARPARL